MAILRERTTKPALVARKRSTSLRAGKAADGEAFLDEGGISKLAGDTRPRMFAREALCVRETRNRARAALGPRRGGEQDLEKPSPWKGGDGSGPRASGMGKLDLKSLANRAAANEHLRTAVRLCEGARRDRRRRISPVDAASGGNPMASTKRTWLWIIFGVIGFIALDWWRSWRRAYVVFSARQNRACRKDLGRRAVRSSARTIFRVSSRSSKCEGADRADMKAQHSIGRGRAGQRSSCRLCVCLSTTRMTAALFMSDLPFWLLHLMPRAAWAR